MLNRKTEPKYSNIQPLKFEKTEKVTLPNGIELYVINGGSQELTKLDFLFDAGSRFGSHPLQAAYASSMLNEGTKTRKAFDIAETFDYYGAHFNPSAEKDGATVSLVTLNKYVNQTFEVVADVLANSIFPENELNTIASKGKQNFLVDSEKTSFLAREYFYENIFGSNHYYGIRNKAEYYDQLNSSLLSDFYNRNYRNAPPKIVASGFITSEIVSAITSQFGKLVYPNHNALKLAIPGIETQTDLCIVEKPGAVQSSIRCGFMTVNRKHPDYMGLKVLTTILGGYFGSRLMKNIREDKGYTYGIHAMQTSLHNAGFMVIGSDVKSDCAKPAMNEIEIEIEKLKSESVSLDELDLVRNFMMGDMLQMFDGPLAKGDAFKTVLPYGLDFEYYNQMQTTITNITPNTLMELAQKYYNTANMVKIVVGVY